MLQPNVTSTMRRRPGLRRGFNLVELLIALAITATLLTATLVALSASFTAYQTTTEEASTHTVGRLVMHRLLTLVRTGRDFGPLPGSPLESEVNSTWMEFQTPAPASDIIRITWDEIEEKLYAAVNPDDGGEDHLLLEDVLAQYDEFGTLIPPFTLEYEKGRHLYRATIDFTIKPDDNMSVTLDGNNEQRLRLVASAMPRLAAY